MLIRDRVRELRRVTAKDLKPNPRNWRTHPKAQQDVLKGLLAEVGYADALLARELGDGTLELIDGHLRAEVTPETQVPVLVLDVDEEEAGKILATLDPLAAMATTDGAKLEELLKSISTSNPAVAGMLEDLAREAQAAVARALVQDQIPAPLPVAVTRPGELWVLQGDPAKGKATGTRGGGNGGKPGESSLGHRLLCGDSTSGADVARVMDGSLAAMVATDPPYLVDYTGERPKHDQRDSGKDWSNLYKEVEIKDADTFFRALFTHALAVMAPNAAIYCWHAHRRCGLIQRIWAELGILDHQQIIWVKPASVFGRVFWHFKHEPCMMGWKQGSMPRHDSDHAFNSVWEIGWEGAATMAMGQADAMHTAANQAGAAREKSRPGDNEHPTQKPVEIFARPMRRHTRAGEVCYEPFSGSGTQIIAAEQLGRRCFAIELQPVFVDVAIRRWQKLSGREAVLEATTATWNEVARERGVDVGATSTARTKSKTKGDGSKPAKKPARAARGAASDAPPSSTLTTTGAP